MTKIRARGDMLLGEPLSGTVSSSSSADDVRLGRVEVEIVPEAEPDREALAVVAVDSDAVDDSEALALDDSDEDASELVDDPELEEVLEALALALELDEAVPSPWKVNCSL